MRLCLGAEMAIVHAESMRKAKESTASRLFPGNELILRAKRAKKNIKWHPPWKLTRVIPGHLGWVRSVSVDPENQWFVTGSNDRTIKLWDLASGDLKLTLTGLAGRRVVLGLWC